MDAHCHLADPRWTTMWSDDNATDFALLDAVIQRSRTANVCQWIQASATPIDWEQQLQVQRRYGGPSAVAAAVVKTAFGLHPWWVAQATDVQVEEALAALCKRGTEANAIGELGLDFMPAYVPDAATKQRQVAAFEVQLRLAQQLNKPMVLHIVKAHEDALRLLKQLGPFPRGGMVHGFTASHDVARRYVQMGFLISVGGAVQRPGFKQLKQTLQQPAGSKQAIPLDHLVLETDCPDCTGSEPASLVQVAQQVALLCGVQTEQLLSISTSNLMRVFL